MIQTTEEIFIIDYHPSLSICFKQLNLEWIEKYFKTEEKDLQLFNDPEKYIIKKGGSIKFAKVKDKVVGTCGFIYKGDGEYQLTKMAVASEYQGKGIGKKILEEMISDARRRRAKQITLYTNSLLQSAIHLYQKFGFVAIPFSVADTDRAERSEIKMVLNLESID